MQMVGVVLILLLAVVAVIGLAYLWWRLEQKRRAQWAAFAQSRGWSYSHEKDRGLADSYQFLEELRRGRNRYAVDVFRGPWHERPMIAFSYHYAETRGSGDDRRTKHYWLSVVSFRIVDDRHFPELTIIPETMLGRFGNLFVKRDIDFESVEFSRMFDVRSADKRFAYDVCHPRMMEYLLQVPGTTLELEGQWIATIHDDKLDLETLDWRLNHLANIANQLPHHLFTD